MTLETITQYFTDYGALAIFIIVFLEYLNLPGFPAGVIMPLSGIMARQGRIDFLFVMLISSIAGLLGSIALYWLGYAGGSAFLKFYYKHFPKQKEKMEKTIAWLEEKGYWGVLIAKIIPVLRTIISIPAGFIKLKFGKYCIYSLVGVFAWNFVFIGAGYIFGDKIFEMLGWLLG